ncbi:MAG: DUF3969 family protein [Leptospiraceae bacterium]|nr:DUF3969 family protein [Leptospiraceae bacterium]MBK7056811.1 DUF3969 family protein [Leptospiraceae bacterium]MBK9498824.1 DUF3969 family protein [Leptospiraceae bacterium]MBL0262717.1 DUF3969 family protein [Leptospiraceae bacterium]
MYFSSNDEKSLNTLLLLICLGMLNAIDKKVLTENFAEKVLFNPRSVKILKLNKKIDPRIADFFLEFLELDDIRRIIPEQYEAKKENLRLTLLSFVVELNSKDELQCFDNFLKEDLLEKTKNYFVNKEDLDEL